MDWHQRGPKFVMRQWKIRNGEARMLMTHRGRQHQCAKISTVGKRRTRRKPPWSTSDFLAASRFPHQRLVKRVIAQSSTKNICAKRSMKNSDFIQNNTTRNPPAGLGVAPVRMRATQLCNRGVTDSFRIQMHPASKTTAPIPDRK